MRKIKSIKWIGHRKNIKIGATSGRIEERKMYLYKRVQEDLGKKESDKVLFRIYCISKFKEIMEDRKKIANYLVDIEYYNEENKQDRKDILWNCFGDILYDNLCKNIEMTRKFHLKDMYKSSSKREQEIKESREKIKKEQEEIVKIPITETLYNYFMGLITRKDAKRTDIFYIFYMSCLKDSKRNMEIKRVISVFTKEQSKKERLPLPPLIIG